MAERQAQKTQSRSRQTARRSRNRCCPRASQPGRPHIAGKAARAQFSQIHCMRRTRVRDSITTVRSHAPRQLTSCFSLSLLVYSGLLALFRRFVESGFVSLVSFCPGLALSRVGINDRDATPPKGRDMCNRPRSKEPIGMAGRYERGVFSWDVSRRACRSPADRVPAGRDSQCREHCFLFFCRVLSSPASRVIKP
jgi:hypothetical protein